MKSQSYLKKVRDQYENYPYPYRDPKDEFKQLRRTSLDMLETVNHYGFAGKRDLLKEKVRCLVAGGGTGDSVVHLAEQLRNNKKAEIVYVDMSKKSMEIAKKRIKNRGLKNVQWRHASLLDIPEMNLGEFDYINCSGVLHHLADPEEGLRALKAVLKEDGVLALLLYGQYGRNEIYMIQDLMRLINETEEDMQVCVDNTKKVLSILPRSNPMIVQKKRWEREIANNGDIGIYDLFLHSQDRAYTVPQLYEFVRTAGLEINEFIYSIGYRKMYQPELFLEKKPELLAKAKKMSREDQQAFSECMAGSIAVHAFFATKDGIKTIANPEDINNVPMFHLTPAIAEPLSKQLLQAGSEKVPVKLMSTYTLFLDNGKCKGNLIKYIDGERSIAEIFAKVKEELPDVSEADMKKDFLEFYKAFNDIDAMLLKAKGIKFDSTQEMQARAERKKGKIA